MLCGCRFLLLSNGVSLADMTPSTQTALCLTGPVAPGAGQAGPGTGRRPDPWGPGSNRGKSNEPAADLALFELLGRPMISVATVRTGSSASVEVVGVGNSVLL